MTQLPTQQVNSQTNVMQSSASAVGGSGIQNLIMHLLTKGLVSQSDVNEAKTTAMNTNKPIEQVLIEQKKIQEEELYKAKAEVHGYKYINVANKQIPLDLLGKINKDVAEKNLAVPFGEAQGKIQVALADPGDLQKVKFLQVVAGKPLELYMSSPSQIKAVIDRQYGGSISKEVDEALEDQEDIVELDSSATAMKAEDVSEKEIDSAPVSRILNMIMEYAVKYKASDVHIEPWENKVVVRFRISGVMVEKLTLPKKLSLPVVARVKILSNLKIDEHRLPQDGRFQIKSGNKMFDIRVSIMPCVYGEKVVMRLLEQGGGEMDLKDTGLRGHAYKTFLEEGLQKTEGIILVTGPTGSGKTHTLASSLKIISKPEVNVLTLENPVEIRMEGITQVQVNPDIGLTFAAGLRSFLRQDPDVIMVGEIRDGETAKLAVEAALTGHLVLATLHTNSAAGAIPRLMDMGIEAFLLSSTMNVVLAQRLVRKICPKCKEAYEASQEEIEKLHKVLDGLKGFDLYSYPPRRDSQGNIIPAEKKDKVILYKGKGCTECNGSGYSGRTGIMEVLKATEKIGQLIMQQRSAHEIGKQAIEDGMITMIQDGFLKALEGVTTLAEVLRVVA
ncbi:type II/IV secretion system protein [Candidatus Dojkabacteria bacterium]|nr:type II/IV secretion system protein [Candidatus Dojkabacteria bacterium]